MPEARRLQTLLAGMPLLLECEVSVPDAPTCWYKDGNPVALDTGALAVQSEECVRRLLIPSVSSLDSGTYTCDVGDDAVSFTVTVDGKWRKKYLRQGKESAGSRSDAGMNQQPSTGTQPTFILKGLILTSLLL